MWMLEIQNQGLTLVQEIGYPPEPSPALWWLSMRTVRPLCLSVCLPHPSLLFSLSQCFFFYFTQYYTAQQLLWAFTVFWNYCCFFYFELQGKMCLMFKLINFDKCTLTKSPWQSLPKLSSNFMLTTNKAAVNICASHSSKWKVGDVKKLSRHILKPAQLFYISKPLLFSTFDIYIYIIQIITYI